MLPNGDYFALAANSLMLATGRKYLQHRNEHGNAPIDFGLIPPPNRSHGMPSDRIPVNLPSSLMTTPPIRLPAAPQAIDLPSPSLDWMKTGTVSSATGARSRVTQVDQGTPAHAPSDENTRDEAVSDDNTRSRASLMEETQKMLQQLANTLKIFNEADEKKKPKNRK